MKLNNRLLRNGLVGSLIVMYAIARIYYQQIHTVLAADFAVNQAQASDAAFIFLRVVLQLGDVIANVPFWIAALFCFIVFRVLSR